MLSLYWQKLRAAAFYAFNSQWWKDMDRFVGNWKTLPSMAAVWAQGSPLCAAVAKSTALSPSLLLFEACTWDRSLLKTFAAISYQQVCRRMPELQAPALGIRRRAGVGRMKRLNPLMKGTRGCCVSLAATKEWLTKWPATFKELLLFRLGSCVSQDPIQGDKSRKVFLGKADKDCVN